MPLKALLAVSVEAKGPVFGLPEHLQDLGFRVWGLGLRV